MNATPRGPTPSDAQKRQGVDAAKRAANIFANAAKINGNNAKVSHQHVLGGMHAVRVSVGCSGRRGWR